MKIFTLWKMIGRYSDGCERIVGSYSEAECLERLENLAELESHGELVWYSGVTDEYYEAGEYVGRRNEE